MSRDKKKSDGPDVLGLLKALEPGTLYQVASKTTFLQGFNAYKTDRLHSFLWVENEKQLQANVEDASPHAVTFSVKSKKLHYQCNCRTWRVSGQCKHIVCSLLTILNLLRPSLFQQSGKDERRWTTLKSQLLKDASLIIKPGKTFSLAKVKKDKPIEIVVEVTGSYPSVFLRREGTVLDAPSGLPEELSAFTYRYYTDQSLRDRFFKHLTRFGNKYPLVLESSSGKISLRWDAMLSYQSKTELNLLEPDVEANALALLDGAVCKNIERFWDFVVDPNTGKMGRVSDTEGWRLFDQLDRLFRPATPALDPFGEGGARQVNEREWIAQNRHFKVPLKTFQSIQFNITQKTLQETLDRLVLKVAGKVVLPLESKHRYRLTINPGEESEEARLWTECLHGDSEGVTTAHTFKFFTDIYTQNLPTPLRALKRLMVFYQTFFHLFKVKTSTEANKVIKKALANGDFVQYAIKRPARDLLKHYFETLNEPDLRLHVNDQQWFIVPNEKEKEALLYQIPFELYGPKIFKEMDNYHTLSLPRKQLYAQLSILYAKCKDAGISLYHKGKPVKTVKWDFSFDARRKTGIDWFEIRPEIKSDGIAVGEKVWQKLLQQNGIIEEEGTIQIVDSNAQKIINALSLIYHRPDAGPREKKEIVQIPRMQILDWVALRKEGVMIRLSEEDEALIQDLTQLQHIAAITTPRNLIAKLRPYQKEGLDWLAFLYQHRFGAILADDMGLGKTLQAISLLAALKEKILVSEEPQQTPHLIVVPPTLLFNWEQELERFYPKLRLYQYIGKDRKIAFEDFDLILTTYAIVRRDIKKLIDIPFHVIIFDEAQAVKNVYADTTGAVRQLKAKFKLVMTGTPLENHLGEYYSLIDLALPGLLGEYDVFKSQVKLEDSPMLQILIRRTQPFVLRRMKEDVLQDLPPKVESDLYLDLTPNQKKLYQQTVALISSQINQAYREKAAGQAKIIALTAIMKLRQLCVSPRLLGPDFKDQKHDSPKLDFLLNQLEELHEEGHSALVFSQFTKGLDLVEALLKDSGLPFCRLDGSTPTPKRKILVKTFQESTRPSVFLLSLKAGGQGLNLTKASYVFHLDPWWNPAVENQASDRAHRIGQTQKVSITRILMRHTIEEKMMVLKRKKLALYDAVMGGPAKGGEAYRISKTDFDFLLSGVS